MGTIITSFPANSTCKSAPVFSASNTRINCNTLISTDRSRVLMFPITLLREKTKVPLSVWCIRKAHVKWSVSLVCSTPQQYRLHHLIQPARRHRCLKKNTIITTTSSTELFSSDVFYTGGEIISNLQVDKLRCRIMKQLPPCYPVDWRRKSGLSPVLSATDTPISSHAQSLCTAKK